MAVQQTITEDMVNRGALVLVNEHTPGAVAVDHALWEDAQRVALLILVAAIEGKGE